MAPPKTPAVLYSHWMASVKAIPASRVAGPTMVKVSSAVMKMAKSGVSSKSTLAGMTRRRLRSSLASIQLQTRMGSTVPW